MRGPLTGEGAPENPFDKRSWAPEHFHGAVPPSLTCRSKSRTCPPPRRSTKLGLSNAEKSAGTV